MRERFEKLIGAEALDAEQRLAARQPLHHDNVLERLLRVSRRFRRDGDLPAEYRAGAGAVFELPCFLVDDAWTIGDAPPEFAGRLFSHPLEASKFEGLPRDTRRWLATPTSSHRSVLVLDAEAHNPRPWIVKLSVDFRSMGFSRELEPKQIAHAVIASHYVADAHARSGGRLADGTPWWLQAEPFALHPAGRASGGYIARRPEPEGKIQLPYYALLCDDWFERLRAADGRDRQTFFHEKIAQPLVGLYHLLAIDYGLSPELHRQNVALAIDRRSLAIEGLVLRDMDGVTIDLAWRRERGLPEVFEIPEWARALPDVLRSDDALLTQAFNFFFLGAMNLDPLAKALFPRRVAATLRDRAERLHLDALGVARPTDLPAHWDRIHRRLAPDAHARVSAKKRRWVRRFGRFRELERSLSSTLGWVRGA